MNLKKVELTEDLEYEKETKDFLKISEIKRAHQTSGIREAYRLLKAFVTGRGIERSEGDVGLIRKLLNSPRIFKIIARIINYLYPHNLEKEKLTIDFGDDRHLRYVHRYTLHQNHIQANTGSGRRSEIYYKVLSNPPRDLGIEKLLIIGPKNTNELFIAWLYGFKWKNIYAIDLFSLHPKIEIMNMENILYPENFFQNVTMGNVYGYQLDPEKCISEVSRVLSPGGFFSFNSTYLPTSELPVHKLKGPELIEIFKKYNFKVIYHSFKPTSDSSGIHFWNLQKNDPKFICPDPIDVFEF